MNGPRAIGRLLTGYAHANAQGALENRASLAGQALAMLVNDVMWVVFWASYFERFSLPERSAAIIGPGVLHRARGSAGDHALRILCTPARQMPLRLADAYRRELVHESGVRVWL